MRHETIYQRAMAYQPGSHRLGASETLRKRSAAPARAAMARRRASGGASAPAAARMNSRIRQGVALRRAQRGGPALIATSVPGRPPVICGGLAGLHCDGGWFVARPWLSRRLAGALSRVTAGPGGGGGSIRPLDRAGVGIWIHIVHTTSTNRTY
eukprot:SAG31_NODE_5949_length_2244_cov_2.381818_1_plen_154_part_00